MIPDALKFSESLQYGLRPQDILIFTGSTFSISSSPDKDLADYHSLTWSMLLKFCHHHGYGAFHLSELISASSSFYGHDLLHQGSRFHPAWWKIFAFLELQRRYPNIKYFVFLSEEILTTYLQSEMLHHYLHLLAATSLDNPPHILYPQIEDGNILSNHISLIKNSNWTTSFYWEVIFLAGRLTHHAVFAKQPYYDIDAIAVYRYQRQLFKEVVLLPIRDGMYHLPIPYDHGWRFGDAWLLVALPTAAAATSAAQRGAHIIVNIHQVYQNIVQNASQLVLKLKKATPPGCQRLQLASRYEYYYHSQHYPCNFRHARSKKEEVMVNYYQKTIERIFTMNSSSSS